MRFRIIALLVLATVTGFGFSAPNDWFNVRRYGAIGNGTALDMKGINQAVEACAAAGGDHFELPYVHRGCLPGRHEVGKRHGFQLRAELVRNAFRAWRPAGKPADVCELNGKTLDASNACGSTENVNISHRTVEAAP
jgi:hypothetical protein